MIKHIARILMTLCAVSLLTSCITVRSPSSGHKKKAPPRKARKAPPKKRHGHRAFTQNDAIIIQKDNGVEVNGVLFEN